MNNMAINVLEKQREEINAISKLIVNKVNPIMVMLFGSHARGDWVSDAYTKDYITYEYASDYDILVVVDTEDIKNDIDIWAELQQAFNKITRVAVNLVIDTPEFITKKMQESNYFYVDVKKEGIVLHDTGKFDFRKIINKRPGRTKEMLQSDLDFWQSKAQLFYADYLHNMEDGSFNNAAFHLSQVVESLYFAVLVVLTGYKPKAHNLDRLVQFVGEVTPVLKDVFESSVLAERRAFELLKKAYIEARYRKDYVIKKEDLEYLASRVDILSERVLKLCNDFIGKHKI